MVRSLLKITSIALYCLFVFMCSINQATNENFSHSTFTIFQHMPLPIRNLIIHQYLTLKDAFVTRKISKFFANFTPAIKKENTKYFKPFLNNTYYKNIGFSVEKYCLQLDDSQKVIHTETLCLINSLMDNQEAMRLAKIHFNSCVFVLFLQSLENLSPYNCCVIFGGFGDFEDKMPLSHVKGRLVNIKMNERAILLFIRNYNRGIESFSIGDPDFGGEIPDYLKGPDLRGLMLTGHLLKYTCSIWNQRKVTSWGNFHVPEEIPPPDEVLENVLQFTSNDYAICVLLMDGTVLAWGNPRFGGKIPEYIQPLLRNINEIDNTEKGFIALSKHGKKFAWGYSQLGNFSSVMQYN